jgi:apolipoprotein N-acyltransferase
VALAPVSIALVRAAGGRRGHATRPFIGSRLYRRSFGLGLTAGAVYFAGTLYWIPQVLTQFGDLAAPVGVLLTGLLVAFLALYPACWALGVAFLLSRIGRTAWVVAPALWVGTELARGYILGGFPWVLLGYSQVTILPIAQLASVTGVYGLSALLVASGVALAAAATAPTRRHAVWACAPLLAGIAAIAAWGTWRIAEGSLTRGGESLSVGLIQGNVPQDQKWNRAFARTIFNSYLTMSGEAVRRGAKLLIWPESSTPFTFEIDLIGRRAIEQFARTSGVPVLFGSDQREPSDAGIRFYNAAYLVDGTGRMAAVYRKIHLVPFGEYVPFRTVLFFASPLVETVSDFTPGTEPVLMPIGSRRVTTAICYEVIYPHLVSAAVDRGAELLTTITNDAWYGPTSAPLQHFEQAAMRAIEQGRYLARSANTGVSGVVDPYGRVLVRSRLFERETIVHDVRLLDGRTIYGRLGDTFAYLCVALSVAALAAATRSGQRSGAGSPA